MEKRVLLVEDELRLCEIISDYFREKSSGKIEIVPVTNGGDALLYALGEEFDLVLLDVMLPEVDGFTICRELRKRKDTPIIFLTARGEEADRLSAYRLGGDDYMVKPFSVAELYQKVNSWLRRCRGESGGKITVGEIELDTHCLACKVCGRAVALPPKEFAILRLLMENAGRLVTRESLLVRLWGVDFEGSDRVVDNHIKKLRAALGTAGAQVKTVVKQGYRLEA